VFGTVTLSSFASGAMLSGAGWIMVQIAVMPFVMVAGVAVLWWPHPGAGGTTMLHAPLSPCKLAARENLLDPPDPADPRYGGEGRSALGHQPAITGSSRKGGVAPIADAAVPR
jgi:hypothetical protein